MAGNSFASDNCEGAFKCGLETAGQNLIIQTRGRNSMMQGGQWKTLAYADENLERQRASKTHSSALPHPSYLLWGTVWLYSFLWSEKHRYSKDPTTFPSLLYPTASGVTSTPLSSPWNRHHAEFTAAITTVTLPWKLHSSSRVEKFQRQMFLCNSNQLGRGKWTIYLFPCF